MSKKIKFLQDDTEIHTYITRANLHTKIKIKSLTTQPLRSVSRVILRTAHFLFKVL